MIYFDSQLNAKTFEKKEEKELSLKEIEEQLSNLYTICGAHQEDNFVFVSSGVEAINQVIFSCYLQMTRTIGKNHFVASQLEDAAVLLSMERLQEEFGCKVTLAQVSAEGHVTKQSLAEAVAPRTALVSISWVNPLTGVIQPIEELAALCKQRGILLHVDATHVFGKGDYDFRKSGADFMTLSGSPLHGPIGTGLLWIREGVEIAPLIVGGYEQAGLRAGTYSMQFLIELCEALKNVKKEQEYMCTEIARLKFLFENQIVSNIADARVLFDQAQRVPHITCINFPKVSSDAMHFYLSRKKLHCAKGGGQMQRIEHVLKACKIESRCGLSFGLSCLTTEQQVTQAVELIKIGYEKLRKASEKIELGLWV